MANRALKRRLPGLKTPKERIVVYTEGVATEIEYLGFVRQAMGIPKELIEIRKAECTHADGIIEEIVEAARVNRAEARRGRAARVEQWWAVLDTETRPASLTNAIQKAKANGIYIVISDPSFEFWLRLHFGYTARQYQSVQELIRELHSAGYLPTYSMENKHPDMDILYPLLPTAMDNARRLRKGHTKEGFGQPRTDCDLLIDMMASSAKEGKVAYQNQPFVESDLSMYCV